MPDHEPPPAGDEACVAPRGLPWRFVVTGADGFLGRRVVCLAAAAGGAPVPVVGRTVSPAPRWRPPSGCIVADVTRPCTLAGVFDGCGAVIHAAGLAHVFDHTGAMDAQLWRVNADGTENIARAAAEAGVRHLVLVSSAAVYGPHEGWVDETAPCRPEGAYAQSKLEAERRATEVATRHGMALTILRPVTMYGEGDPGNVYRLIRAIDRRRFLWIGSGTNRKSLLHRDDVAEACILALKRAPQGVEVFNVAGPAYEMREVISTIARELRRAIPPVRVPPRLVMALVHAVSRVDPTIGGGRNGLLESLQKWVRDDVYDGDKMRRVLGWQPRIDLQSGLRREIRWYLDSKRRARP